MNWQSQADWQTFKERAVILSKIRQFFEHKNVTEIETPVLAQHGVSDPHLDNFKTNYQPIKNQKIIPYFLQTSPEFAMKRLVAQFKQPIYQIGKAFRHEDSGHLHNPEFTLLEWYQPHYSLDQLIDEVDELIQLILLTQPAIRLTYQQVFLHYVGVDPLQASYQQLFACTSSLSIQASLLADISHSDLLQLLFTLQVEPHIGQTTPCFITHFPYQQAALAKLTENDQRTAQRFELYFQGVELANGFDELTDASEQVQRFNQDNTIRHQLGYESVSPDSYFVAALDSGLPQCSGVALGIDRIIMLALNKACIQEVISFPFHDS